MHTSSTFLASLLLSSAAAFPTSNTAAPISASLETRSCFGKPSFIDWKTYDTNGVNLGSWLVNELAFDPAWFAKHAPNAVDEWTLCEALGPVKCALVFEERYATIVNTTTMDQLASVGVNTIRIPTTYAAWVKVPGSHLYTGFQQIHLLKIALYAIVRYNMHVIIGLHSLPGGTNTLDIGEAVGHYSWFFNNTNLDYSYQAVDRILSFIQATGHIGSFTVSPINEAADNPSGLFTPAGLTTKGSDWIAAYFQGVVDRVAKVDRRIPVMLQDCFQGAAHWAPYFDASANIAFDTHKYYFEVPDVSPTSLPAVVCEEAKAIAESQTKFPVMIGEWALQTKVNNTYADRKSVFEAQRNAWAQYTRGGSFWTAVGYGKDPVDGEGTKRAYWTYTDLITAGIVTNAQVNKTFCS